VQAGKKRAQAARARQLEKGKAMKVQALNIITALSICVLATGTAVADTTLDYDYYKARVEPIFLKKRPTHTRCVVCHAGSNNALKLEKLGKDGKFADADSRKNFTVVSALVTPGSAEKSHLLTYPLAPEAGGGTYHSGGRQFATRNDQDWKTIAAWANGAKLKGAPAR
jgi:hypothetical protein